MQASMNNIHLCIGFQLHQGINQNAEIKNEKLHQKNIYRVRPMFRLSSSSALDVRY